MMQRRHFHDFRSVNTNHIPSQPRTAPPPARREGEEMVHENIFVKPVEKMKKKKFQKQ